MKKIRNNSGFTLVELAVVTAIIGIIIAGISAMVRPALIQYQNESTRDNLDIIARNLALYVQRNYRLPCPADPAGTGPEPFGFQRDSGATGTNLNTDCTAAGKDYGIVPFKSIGLPEDAARDAWGYYISYRVSHAYARKYNEPTEAEYKSVHEYCRTPQWYSNVDFQGHGSTAGSFLNYAKARFCCPSIRPNPEYGPNSDIVIRDGNGNDIWGHVRENGNSRYADTDTQLVKYKNMVQYNNVHAYTPGVAYVLIAYGADGNGAFAGNGTTDQISSATPGTKESENIEHSANRIYVTMPVNMSDGADHFDDTVLWRTGDAVISELGNDSCAKP